MDPKVAEYIKTWQNTYEKRLTAQDAFISKLAREIEDLRVELRNLKNVKSDHTSADLQSNNIPYSPIQTTNSNTSNTSAVGPEWKIQPHRHAGVFIAQGKKTDALVTLSAYPGGVEIVQDEASKPSIIHVEDGNGSKKEYRVWNPFECPVAAAVLEGVEHIYMKPGTKVLVIGGSPKATIPYISDIVGPNGAVYAAWTSEECGRELSNMCRDKPNIFPIAAEDARTPAAYAALVGGGVVDGVVAVAVGGPDQADIVVRNVQQFVQDGFFIDIVSTQSVDATAPAHVVSHKEVTTLRDGRLIPREMVTLEPYYRDYAAIVGIKKLT